VVIFMVALPEKGAGKVASAVGRTLAMSRCRQ
jgi:hypothetical protein